MSFYIETLFTQTMFSEIVIQLYFDCSVMLNTSVLHRIQKTHQRSDSLHMKRQWGKNITIIAKKTHNKYEHWISSRIWRHRNEDFFLRWYSTIKKDGNVKSKSETKIKSFCNTIKLGLKVHLQASQHVKYLVRENLEFQNPWLCWK